MSNNLTQKASAGLAWAIILTPLGVLALVWILPHLLEILGWLTQAMRDFAAAVKR
jgi:hypothetical protein